jgi:hypothetical protein
MSNCCVTGYVCAGKSVCASNNYFSDDISTSLESYILNAGDTLRIMTSRTPSSSTDNGFAGEICWDSDYIYLCISTNSWKRIGLSTF